MCFMYSAFLYYLLVSGALMEAKQEQENEGDLDKQKQPDRRKKENE